MAGVHTPLRKGLTRGGGFAAGFARTQQAIAECGGLFGRRVPLRDIRELLRRVEAEELEEERGRAVQHRAELRAAGLLDQAALDQRGGRGLRGDAADAGDL